MAGMYYTDYLETLNINLVSSMSSKEYFLEWILEEFSQLPLEEMPSPPLEPVPTSDVKLSFKKMEEELYFYLENSSERNLTIDVTLSICDLHEKRWLRQYLCKNYEMGEKIDILQSSCNFIKDLNYLLDDTLIISCSLKIIQMFSTKVLDDESGNALKYDGRFKLCADIKNLLKDNRHADVTLRGNGGGQVPANRAVLCARSPVFEKMFYHEKERDSVLLHNVELPALQKLVDFLHAGEAGIDKDFESAKALYFAADKYEVMDLRNMCADVLVAWLSVENYLETLAMADRHMDEYLMDGVLTFFSANINDVTDAENWEEFVISKPRLAARLVRIGVKRIKLRKS